MRTSIKNLQKQIDELDTTKQSLTKIRPIADEYGKDQEAVAQLWKQGGPIRDSLLCSFWI